MESLKVYSRILLVIFYTFGSLTSCGATKEEFEIKTIFEDSNISLLSHDEIKTNHFFSSVGNLMAMFSGMPGTDEKFVIPKCTGIQISLTHVLTAKHCIMENLTFNKDQIATDEDLNKLAFKVYGKKVRLSFNGVKIEKADEVLHQPVFQEATYIDSELDFAIYKLPIKNVSNHVSLFQSKLTDNGDKELILIGHPNGIPLSKSTHCFGRQVNNFLYHTCDSLPGVSGGLIIAKDSNLPIAMHISGSAKNNGKYYTEHDQFESVAEIGNAKDCIKRQGDYELCLITEGRNKAIFFTDIIARLKNNSPKLLQDIKNNILTTNNLREPHHTIKL